jgi:hypothetical protein
MGYFSFAYEGYDPQARILTRNTFDPWTRMLSRLGVIQTRIQTAKPDKAVMNLTAALDEGTPAIVWADYFTLSYNNLPFDRGWWAGFPVVVYGYDTVADRVWIADRSRAPLWTTTGNFTSAWGRVKADKHRLMTLEAPDEAKVADAVRLGIWDAIKLFTEAPPKGTTKNFGLAAYRNWAELLTKPTARMSWAKEFPAPVKLYAGLKEAYTSINHFGIDGHAERDVYADFLVEAAIILNRPALTEAAGRFQEAAAAWDGLSAALLPESVPPLAETRALLDHRHRLFMDRGSASLDDIRAADERLAAQRAAVVADFPLDEPGVVALREAIAAQVMKVHDVEAEAVTAMQAAMA